MILVFSYLDTQIERPIHVTKFRWRDILWMLCMKLIGTPMWTGWNALTKEDAIPVQKIQYMENITLSPTQLDVVAETLNISQKVVQECHEPYAVVTYDLVIVKLALQTQSQEAPRYDNVFICISAFHIALAYFGCLWKYWDVSGGPNILTESGVLAHGSLNGFLLEKHYNRCKRLHPLLATAMQCLHFDAFLGGAEFDQVTTRIKEVNFSPVARVIGRFRGIAGIYRSYGKVPTSLWWHVRRETRRYPEVLADLRWPCPEIPVI